MKFTKKLTAGVAAAAVLAATATWGVTSAEAVERMRWPMPMSFASTLTALGDTAPWVAERVSEMSDGAMTLEVFEPGKLVPPLQIFDAVSAGDIEAGYAWMGYEQGQIPASALFGARPFGLEPADYVAWYYYGGGQELVREVYEPHNVYPIFCGTISPEAAGWFTFPLEDLEQVRGLKFRAAGLGGKVMEEVGASVTVLPGGELYQALERGVLDATEFSLPTVDQQLGFHQVAKFYHLPGWHQPSTSQYLYVNMDAWNSLDAQQQSILETACMAGVTHAIAKAEGLQGEVLNRFTDELGVTAVRIPEEILRALHEATMTVLEREAENDEMFAKVLESQIAFQKEHKPWKELGYLPRDWPIEPASE